MADFGMKYLPPLPSSANQELKDAYTKINEVLVYVQERLKLTNADSNKNASSISSAINNFNNSISSSLKVIKETKTLATSPSNSVTFTHGLGYVPTFIVQSLPDNTNNYKADYFTAITNTTFTVNINALAGTYDISFLVG